MTISGGGGTVKIWKYWALAIFNVKPGFEIALRGNARIVNGSAVFEAYLAKVLTIIITNIV
jgi:hypothetical protein